MKESQLQVWVVVPAESPPADPRQRSAVWASHWLSGKPGPALEVLVLPVKVLP